MVEGFGIGLRAEHYADFAAGRLGVDWLEIVSENYLVPGGRPRAHLDRIRADYPMVMHGVSLSIGGTDALDFDYLRDLRRLADRVEPAWLSDHLCWTGIDGRNLHDLMPLPMTRLALRHVGDRVARVQDFLGRPIALENVSSYVRFAADEMAEWEFVRELLGRTGCGLLLDLNNVYVSSVNHGFDPGRYVDAIPAERVWQIHLAGHTVRADGFLIDTHDAPVCDAVWALYRRTIERIGARPTMIERDDRIPPLDDLLAELGRARRIAEQAAPAHPATEAA